MEEIVQLEIGLRGRRGSGQKGAWRIGGARATQWSLLLLAFSWAQAPGEGGLDK